MSAGARSTHDVYISYSPQDKKWADATCAALERHRIRCWIAPRDIGPGEELSAAIMNGINGSRIMVLIFSDHANTSGKVSREVERATGRGMPILPIRFEAVPFKGSIEYSLANTQWLDAFTKPVERNLELVARSVQKLLGRDVKPESGEEADDVEEPRTESPPGDRHWRAWAGVAAGVLMIGLIGAWLGGVFKSRTAEKQAGPEVAETTSGSMPVAPKVVSSPLPTGSRADTERFIPLFNGQDLAGWKVAGNADHTWKVLPGGILEGSGLAVPGGGSHLTTERDDFANFHLRLETKLAEGEDKSSRIRFRVTESNQQPVGYDSMIPGTGQADQGAGSLSISVPGSVILLAKADPAVPIKPDEWFSQEVIADGDVITVLVKGRKVLQFKTLHHGLASGSIGLTCRRSSKVVFRKIEIKKWNESSLDRSIVGGPKAGDSSESVDWSRMGRLSGSGIWQIEGNELVQTTLEQNAGIAFGDPTWSNYGFSTEVKIEKCLSHIDMEFRDGGESVTGNYFFSAGMKGVDPGSICSMVNGKFSILPARRSGDAFLNLGQWHKMKINVQGNQFTASLDGRVVLVASDAAKQRGSVGLHSMKAVCRFRNIKVTAPNGETLWEGLPVIPTAGSFGVRL